MNASNRVEFLLEHGVLLSPDLVGVDVDNKVLLEHIRDQHFSKTPLTVFNSDYFHRLPQQQSEIDWIEFDKTKVVLERSGKEGPYLKMLQTIFPERQAAVDLGSELQRNESEEGKTSILGDTRRIRLLRVFEESPKKIDFKDFVMIFKSRYEFLRKVLQSRPELQNVSSINKLGKMSDRNDTSVIGLVYDKIVTKNGNILLTLEDVTGFIKVVVGKGAFDLYRVAENVCLDEVLGITGSFRDRFFFAKNILFPEVVNAVEKNCGDEVYAAFISDIHVGSRMFLEEQFRRFIRWLNGGEGEEAQRSIGLQVKYLFVVGDLVDGIGVFPNQEKYLTVLDIREQYNQLAALLNEIRKDLTIIICPGQHDSVRVAEPQPVLDRDFAAAIWNLPHVLLVSNPALVNIHAGEVFEGYTVLMYHGASFHYYIDSVPMLRAAKARDNPSHVLKLLLQKRHLAPSYGSTIYVPHSHEDALLIQQTPDIIACGDMHRSDVSHYNGVLTINCSCWQSKTDFQEKTGNNPDPCKVPVFNLRTRQISVISFE